MDRENGFGADDNICWSRRKEEKEGGSKLIEFGHAQISLDGWMTGRQKAAGWPDLADLQASDYSRA